MSQYLLTCSLLQSGFVPTMCVISGHALSPDLAAMTLPQLFFKIFIWLQPRDYAGP